MRIILIIVLVAVVGALGYFFFVLKDEDSVISEEPIEQKGGGLKSVDFSRFSAALRFSAKIPAEFAVEYIPQVKAASVYDPRLPGQDLREKSQLYITSFEANRFLTLSTVEITQQDETLIQGHDAVLYEITKKPEVPDFIQQPSWRNFKHKAVDVRFTKNNHSIFYSFAYNPTLPKETFDDFLNSLMFHNDKESFQPPLPRFIERIIKKPFGLKVSPQDSPVQPEFFSGFHTAIDYEIFPEEEDTDVSVFAVCGGELRVKRTASGYGGVAVQDCLLGDNVVTVVYGHLLLSSITQDTGFYFAPGEVIGNLAPKGKEAGGGRKHLHLGIHKGSQVDIQGYVDTQGELTGWVDPAPILLLQ